MTLHARQQLLHHKTLYVRGLRPVVVVALFACAEWHKSNGRFSPGTYKICLLPFSSQTLPAVAAWGSGSPPSRPSAGSCCCLSFPSRCILAAWFSCTSRQNHCVCPKKSLLWCLLQPSPCTHPSAGSHNRLLPACLTILAGLPAHLSVYFPVFSPHFTPCCVFKCNFRTGGLFPLPPSPPSHQSPCLASPAERL